MASQGQSFFQAAGDSAGYRGNAPWPANSAYVTAVGGTDLDTQSAGGPWASETVWADGGGGWGTNVTIPSWQVTAADDCNTLGGDCSKTDRDVPDVSANANFSFYVCADQTTCTANLYGGTSFAAPMWAGYLALTNQQAAANSDPAPGFINSTIYPLNLGNGDVDFHDIISGSNGFTCVAGYNMCGGWGSPNGDALINALAPVPSGSFTIAAAPDKIKIAQGATGLSKITTTISGGFDSAVALSATGQPTGVTVAFKPSSIAAPGSGSAKMQIKVASTAKTGISTITVTGTGGGVTQTTTVEIDVTN
jgi:kumamolisin